MPYHYAIIGFGPAGIFALASLPEHLLQNTLILEDNTVGGDLATVYSGIKANITKKDIVTAFRKIPRWSENNAKLTFLLPYEDNECPFLSDVSKQIREWIIPDVKKAQFHKTRMNMLIETNDHWKIQTDHELFEAKKVIVCTGSKPKTLNLPKISVPLQVALSVNQLRSFVSPSDRIVVFGCAHSGTLILKNLKELGCSSVTAIYKGKAPFQYARDRVNGGIKQESAKIADEIVANAWNEYTPTLLSLEDFPAVYRVISNADIVIYSIGFESNTVTYTTKSGLLQQLEHNPTDLRFLNVVNVWGFGSAFPRHNPYPDIGFNGFIDAIQTALPSILESSV